MPDLAYQPAYITLRYMNPNMLIGQDNSHLINGIEDHSDPDGRVYRMEYISTLDGKHANAYIRSNPWDRSDPQAGTVDHVTHVYPNGYICMGTGMSRITVDSPFKLEDVIKRTRFWCIAFSVYKETDDSSVFEL